MSAPITLDFVIDEDYLIAHALSSPGDYSHEHAGDIGSMRQKMDAISLRAYLFLAISLENVIDLSLDQLVHFAEETRAVLALKETAEYKTVLAQTQEYKERVEQEWDANLERSFGFMQEITGLALDNSYTVFLTHPSLYNGRYLGNRRIAWGHPQSFENYDTIFLWHEILHDDDNLGTSNDISHAIIELLADNSLRVHLNGTDFHPLLGHHNLESIRKRIFDHDWRDYVTGSSKHTLIGQTKDILSFKAAMERKYARREDQ